MATQILRTVDRWRFETPLALALAAAAGFATLAMPHEIFGRLPVIGARGAPGHVALALVLAVVCGVVGYVAMRRPAKRVPADEDAESAESVDAPSGMSEDRLVRLRRADRHPDAPPRAPIRASRDLGEPFMDVGAFAPPPRVDPVIAATDAPAEEAAMLDGDYVEIDHADEEAAAEDGAEHHGAAADEAGETLELPVEAVAAAEPVAADIEPQAEEAAAPIADYSLGKPYLEAVAVKAEAPASAATSAAADSAAPREDLSIAAMMERLSAGMERRSGRPVTAMRDMRPALRDALDELNRLAERRA